MRIEDLKQLVAEMPMDDELKEIIYELMEGADEVSEDLLHIVAGVMEMQAEFYEKASSVLLDEADEYEALEMTLKDLDNKEIEQKLETVIEEQEGLIAKLDQKMEEFKRANTEEKPEEPGIAKAQDELNHIASSTEIPMPTPPAVTQIPTIPAANTSEAPAAVAPSSDTPPSAPIPAPDANSHPWQ